MNRKLLLMIIVVITMTLVLSSCQKKDEAVQNQSFIARGESIETIKIGVIEPLTGKNSYEGKKELLGIKYANENRNIIEVGGIDYPIELVYMDNESDIDKNIAAAKDLVKKGVIAVLGSYNSELTLSASQIFEAAKIPVVTASNTVKSVTFGKPYHFRTSFLDTFQGTVMGNFAREEGLDRVALLTEENSEYFSDLAKYFKGAFEANNGRVVYVAFTVFGQTDFTDIIKDLKKQKVQGVFLNLRMESAQAFAKAVKANDLNIELLGGDSYDNSHIISKNTVGMKIVTFFDERDKSSRASTTFVKKLKKYIEISKEALELNGNSKEVHGLTALGYDAYNTVYYGLKAIEDDVDAVNGEMLKDTLSKISILGVTGQLAFDENGDIIKDTAYIREVTKESLKTNRLSYLRKQQVGNSYVD